MLAPDRPCRVGSFLLPGSGREAVSARSGGSYPDLSRPGPQPRSPRHGNRSRRSRAFSPGFFRAKLHKSSKLAAVSPDQPGRKFTTQPRRLPWRGLLVAAEAALGRAIPVRVRLDPECRRSLVTQRLRPEGLDAMEDSRQMLAEDGVAEGLLGLVADPPPWHTCRWRCPPVSGRDWVGRRPAPRSTASPVLALVAQNPHRASERGCLPRHGSTPKSFRAQGAKGCSRQAAGPALAYVAVGSGWPFPSAGKPPDPIRLAREIVARAQC